MSVAGWALNDSPEMDEEQFRLWKALLENRTGMQLTEQRKRFLETSLCKRMREVGCDCYGEYYEQLVAGTGRKREWAALVDHLTVQETSFFRHLSSFSLVRNTCRELWSQGNGSQENRSREKNATIELWSVGCSTGEEAYSLAMLLDELHFECSQNESNEVARKEFLQNARFGITATDISLPALSKARDGIYNVRKLDHVEPTLREKYFSRVDERRYQVVPQLKERVCFARINVLELSAVPFHDVDIIFCQNLLIYFKRWRKKDIVNALTDRLKVGGLLVLGLGEVVDWEHPKIVRMPYENTLAYTRIK